MIYLIEFDAESLLRAICAFFRADALNCAALQKF